MRFYIHVPFCRHKCGYCSFFSLVPSRKNAWDNIIKHYQKTLLAELATWRERLGTLPVQSIFFGGGTPSLLPATYVGEVINTIAKLFPLSPQAEITVEANPDSAVAGTWLHDVSQAGVNRLSLGVQSFDEEKLRILGRVHNQKDIYKAVELARQAKFFSISLDLMWGLPGEMRQQTSNQWLKELEIATSLAPEHISAYELSLEKATPLAKRFEKGEIVFPAESTLARMYEEGASYLESQGFLQYEISNFARLGFACAHNIGYWQQENYIGLGPSAASTLGSLRWKNPNSLIKWEEAVDAKAFGAEQIADYSGEFERLTLKTEREETIMLRLRTSQGISLALWKERGYGNFLHQYSPLVKPLIQNYLATIRNKHFKLTRLGMLVSNTIIEHFFEHTRRIHPS